MKQNIENIRNVAIIAHVDHGKTTLVDQLLKQSGIFRSNQAVQERVMDSGDIERERGITILSKNTAVNYGDMKIYIIDTPGHADFGGEVERVLKMVDGVVLVVDAFEGPMPQTKFVLRKALELNHPVVVCVNKIDRPEARPDDVIDEVLELFMELDANDDQLDSPFVFASARGGYASEDSSAREGDMKPLFEAIINHIPAPKGDIEAPAQALISTIDYSEYLGRIGIGKIENGTLKVNDEVVVLNMHNAETQKKVRITKLYQFEGLQRVEVKEASVGNIVALSGIENIAIGDTICSPEKPEALPFVKISEPTLVVTSSRAIKWDATGEANHKNTIINAIFNDVKLNPERIIKPVSEIPIPNVSPMAAACIRFKTNLNLKTPASCTTKINKPPIKRLTPARNCSHSMILI